MLDRSQDDITREWITKPEPLVSVCCITYNHVRFIEEAIDSFLMQKTNFAFEVLVHDDASTDGTAGIIQEYAKRYPDIIRPIIQTVNQFAKCGLINPRFVFPKARGKYIALCEGDDYWTDCTKLQKQVQFLDNNPEYVITYTDCKPFDEKGYVNINYGAATRDVSSDELKRAVPLYTATTCFRNVINEFPLDLMSARLGDLVIWSLLGAHGNGKYLSDIVPAAYRVHDGGIHSKRSVKNKNIALLITTQALYAYYLRLGDVENSQYFLELSVKSSAKVVGYGGLTRLVKDICINKIKRGLES